MTKQIKSAIEHLDDLIGMVEDNRNTDYDSDFKLAIRSLKAWDEVLNELEETKEHATDLVRPKILGRKIKELTDMCFDEAIKIINKKLSKVEDGRNNKS